MSTYRVLPRIVGTYDGWTLSAGADKVVAVQTDDGDTTIVTDTGANDKQSYFMAPVTGVLASVASIDVSGKAKHATAGSPSFTQQGIKQGATDTPINSIGGTTSYVLTTTNRATSALGAAWTPALVDLTEDYIFSQTVDDGPTFTVTWVYWDVNGEFIVGGLLALVAGALGPLAAVGLMEIPKLVRALAKATHNRVRVSPNEYYKLYRALNECRYPRHFLMGAA